MEAARERDSESTRRLERGEDWGECGRGRVMVDSSMERREVGE